MRGGIGEIGDPAFTVTTEYQHAIALENHPADSRIKILENGVVQTLSARMGTGGNNVPLVMESDVAAFKGGQGSGFGISYSENTSPTLLADAGGNTVPMVLTKQAPPS